MANPVPTTPPVPTRSPMTDSGGLASRPWIAWFTTLGKLFGFNQTIQSDGANLPGEVSLNFLSPFIVTDNPANGSTDISLPAAAYTLQRGTAAATATLGDYSTAAVVFSEAFNAVPQVFVNPTNFPRAANAPLSCYATDITVAGFTVNLACAVPTGGGGATIDNTINVDWIALG